MPNKGTIINPTEAQVDARQQSVESALSSRADEIPGVSDFQAADLRDILPDQDLTATTDNGWTQGDREFVQSGMVDGTAFDAYSIDSNNQAQDKIIAIYGVANVASDPITTSIEFQDGTDANFYEVNTQTFDLAELSDVLLFEQNIVYGVNQDGTIIQWPTDDGTDRVIYLGKVLEQTGNTVIQRSG